MASIFKRGNTHADQQHQTATESTASQATSPTPGSTPEAAPATQPALQPGMPSDAAPSPHLPHDGPATAPEAAVPPRAASVPPNGATRETAAPGAPYTVVAEHRPPAWRWLVGAVAALVVLALLLTGAWALGRSAVSSGTTAHAPGVVALPPSTQDVQQSVINVIHVVQPSVVQVTSGGTQGGAIGSGEILTADGYIVTNDHVVAGFTTYSVTLANGQSVPAQLVGVAPQDDLAVLRIQQTHLRPIAIGDSRAVQVGQFAIAMGSPLGLQQSSTLGIVSALNRQAGEAQGGPVLTGLIQTSAPINPGNSGGALVDLQGRLIGIPTLAVQNPESGVPANGIGFAIPSDRMTFITHQLIQYGHVVNSGQGFLGIQGVDVTPELSDYYNLPVSSGVLIAGFTADPAGSSPAQQAGLQRGDIVVAVDGTAIANQADLLGVLLGKAPGTKVTITVQRGSNQHAVTVQLGQRPAGP